MEGEANSSNRYRIFSEKADAEGHPQIAKLFRAISMSESIHQRNHEAAIRELGGTVNSFKLVRVHPETTEKNLKWNITGEKQESVEMYPEFIGEARQAGAKSAAETFVYARDSERQHEALLRRALKDWGKNNKMDYYVDTKTGATLEREIGSRFPAVEKGQGEFVKVK